MGHSAVFFLSLFVTVVFFIYGLNHYYLLHYARRYKNPPLLPLREERPSVAIHLPVYNERYVIRRLVAACALVAERYGREKVKLIIIDDSDDETAREVDRVAAEHLRAGYRMEVLRRAGRDDFKAGALGFALHRTREEYIAIFDADFIPPPEFLTVSIPHFQRDDRLGIIQSRWTHLNREYNFITKAVAIGIDVHFFIEQAGRYTADCFLNFNGSGGLMRRKALIEAGGWQADTLAEDLDMSYRMQMKGYRVLYLRELNSPGEVPPTIPCFRKQQGRWACGSLRTAKKILPTLVRDGKIGLKKRIQACIHLTNYLVHPLMFISFMIACYASLSLAWQLKGISPHLTPGVSPPGLQTGHYADLFLRNLLWFVLGAFVVLSTVAAWIYPLATLRASGMGIAKNVPSLLVLFFIGCGLSFNNTIEVGKAILTNKRFTFARTPKYALERTGDSWVDKQYQVPLDFNALGELLLVCLGFSAMAFAALRADFGPLIVLFPYTASFGFVSVLGMRQSKRG